MDSKPETTTTRRTLFTDAVLVAAVPAGIFLFTYCYEFGYASAFGIPWQLVSVNWSTVLIVSTSLVSVAIVWHILSSFVIASIGILPEPITTIMVELLPMFLFLVALTYYLASSGGWTLWLAVWFLFACYTLSQFFVFPWLYHRKREKTHAERLAAMTSTMKENQRFRIAQWLLIFGLTVSYIIGKSNASRQTQFYVVTTSPESVLLAEYGDTFVLEHFDRKTKTLQGGIIVTKLAPSLTLEREKVGPFSPPKAQ